MPEAAYLSVKDLARMLGLSVRSIKRWSQRLDVPPTIPANSCQRWSPKAVKLFIRRLEKIKPKLPSHVQTSHSPA